MKPSIYLETSIVSYLAAQPSRDLIAEARQQVTHEWWTKRRSAFELFVSDLVLEGASAGDPEVAARRAVFLRGLPVIDLTPLAEQLAERILQSVGLPTRARADALHIALATSHGMGYLMTWNATHIANA